MSICVKDRAPNVSIVGSPVIENNVASGFKANTYLVIDEKIPEGTDTAFYIKVTITGTSGTSHNVVCSVVGIADIPFGFSDKFVPEFYIGTWITNSTIKYQIGDTVWIGVHYDESAYSLYSLLDQGYTKDTVPDIRDWKLTYTSRFSTNQHSGSQIQLGRNEHTPSEYFVGSIDLNDSFITVDGKRWWTGTKEGPKKVNSIFIKQQLPKTKRFKAGSNLVEWVVPNNVTKLKVDCVASAGNKGTGGGGSGGRVQCLLDVTAGQTLYFTVGDIPASPIVVSYNASDIRIGGTAYENRIVTAGGGGSGGYSGSTVRGGDGGGLVGAAGQKGGYSYAGQGGTQTAGGAGGTNHVGGSQWNSPGGDGQFGLGGTSDNHSYHSQLGGIGGAGWYGGGGGAGVHTSNINSCAGGGGGSSNTNDEYCTDVVHTQGYNTGSGYIDIEILDDIIIEAPREIIQVNSGNRVVYAKEISLYSDRGGGS